MAETASRNRGPETSPAPAEPGSTGGGNRRTPKSKRSRHDTNITTHLRVPSGRQVPHVLQEEGTEDGVRLLRSPTPPTIADPWGPLSSMLSRNKDSGGEGSRRPVGHQALARVATLLLRGEGPKGAPGRLVLVEPVTEVGGEGTRASSPRHGGSAEDTGHGGRGHTSGGDLDFFSPNPGAL